MVFVKITFEKKKTLVFTSVLAMPPLEWNKRVNVILIAEYQK